MTSDPTPDRHREALRPILLTMSGETVDETLDRLLAALTPAGPEEPREGLLNTPDWKAGYSAGRRAAIELLRESYDEHANAVIRATPAPDTGAEDCPVCGGPYSDIPGHLAHAHPDSGAEERLRAVLDSIIGEAEEVTIYQHGNPHSVLEAIIRRARAALSSGSVDEERDSDES